MASPRRRLFDRLADIACELSMGQAEALALEFETAERPSAIRNIGGTAAPRSVGSLCELWEKSWETTGIDGAALADALRCAARAIKTVGDYEKVELLYTGPGTDSIRRNQQALLEVIRGARLRLWLVSYVVRGEVDEVLLAIRERAEASVAVYLLVDHRTERADVSLRRLARDVPGCQVLIWTDEKREISPGRHASLHAKCAVADGRQAFVSSANLTGQALDHNLEVGYLVTGGRTPAALERYLMSLVKDDVLTPAPLNRSESP